MKESVMIKCCFYCKKSIGEVSHIDLPIRTYIGICDNKDCQKMAIEDLKRSSPKNFSVEEEFFIEEMLNDVSNLKKTIEFKKRRTVHIANFFNEHDKVLMLFSSSQIIVSDIRQVGRLILSGKLKQI